MTPFLAALALQSATDKLPDITLLPRYLSNAYVTTSNPELPSGTRALRFSTASYNDGAGRLELRGGEVVGLLQRVYQRVHRTDNTWYDREAGWFVYHPGHGHIHFEDWTVFRLRRMLPASNVGEIVGAGSKTSFCIVEIVAEDPTLPGHSELPAFNGCAQVQGLRPGWADVYGATLEGQYIDLTGVPDGVYWLEGDIDPNNQVLESNESNNVVRIPVGIGNPPAVVPDQYEPNNSLAEVRDKPVGMPGSANLGTLRQRRTIRDLSMSDAEDWFCFKMDKIGTGGDFVRVESPWLRQGQINLELYNSAGSRLRSSALSYNWEEISLSGLANGTYYVRVVRSGSTNNPEYWLTIQPAGPPPPRQKFDDPGGSQPETGDIFVPRADEFFPLSWTAAKDGPRPEWASLYRSREKDSSSAEVIDGYERMPGRITRVNVNTVQFGLGAWHIMLRSSAGESFSDEWYRRRVWVYLPGDIGFDGKVTLDEAMRVDKHVRAGRALEPGWSKICDLNHDERVDAEDVRLMYDLAGRSGG
jgi:hypothetical protein